MSTGPQHWLCSYYTAREAANPMDQSALADANDSSFLHPDDFAIYQILDMSSSLMTDSITSDTSSDANFAILPEVGDVTQTSNATYGSDSSMVGALEANNDILEGIGMTSNTLRSPQSPGASFAAGVFIDSNTSLQANPKFMSTSSSKGNTKPLLGFVSPASIKELIKREHVIPDFVTFATNVGESDVDLPIVIAELKPLEATETLNANLRDVEYNEVFRNMTHQIVLQGVMAFLEYDDLSSVFLMAVVRDRFTVSFMKRPTLLLPPSKPALRSMIAEDLLAPFIETMPNLANVSLFNDARTDFSEHWRVFWRHVNTTMKLDLDIKRL